MAGSGRKKPWSADKSLATELAVMNLMQEVQNCIQKLVQSAFCISFLDNMKSPEIFERFRRVLGSQEKMQLVIYKIDSIEQSVYQRLHFSLAILMKRRFTWIGEIEVFDLTTPSLTESRVLRALGCSVVPVAEEQYLREAVKPTLFFMRNCASVICDNVLEANWEVNKLKNIVLFGDSFEYYYSTLGFFSKYSLSTKSFMKEFRVGEFNHDKIRGECAVSFAFQSWHFFSPVSEADLVLQPIQKILPWVPFYNETNTKRESKLMQIVKKSFRKFWSTQFYRSFFNKLHTPEMSARIHKVLGSENKMPIVIYGIGSIELSENSRLQLCLAILMKKRFNWIGEIEVFDPVISLTESKVLTSLGCLVLSVNEQCCRKAVKPTMFMMPHCYPELYNNLLEANWGVNQLNNLFLLGNNFELLTDLPRCWTKHIVAARSYTKSFDFKISFSERDTYFAFCNLCWHFFSPVDEADMHVEIEV